MTPTPEALTPEERALIGSDTSNEDANAVHLARKLLRIHDRQAARIAELEETLALFAADYVEMSENESFSYEWPLDKAVAARAKALYADPEARDRVRAELGYPTG